MVSLAQVHVIVIAQETENREGYKRILARVPGTLHQSDLLDVGPSGIHTGNFARAGQTNKASRLRRQSTAPKIESVVGIR